MVNNVKTGLDTIERSWPKNLRNAKIGLLVHPASINHRLEHASEIFLRSNICRLKALFGPQHGIKGETQDNMIEWRGFRDKKSGLSVYSLYGKTRKPTAAMLKEIDVMVIDLQDVGSRYYTFIWTMTLVMQACLELKKTVVVLDRPNPINGLQIEGPVLKPQYSSFVGLHPLPVRHGMTIGEIALYLKDKFYPALDLRVIEMKGWKREMWFDETGLPWVLPSPNIPSVETAAVYPGMCLLEGTNVSEGRGTTRPFEILGAPFINPETLLRKLDEFRLTGVIFRSLFFKPCFQKYKGKLCGGAQIHITDRSKFKPFKTAVAILKTIHDIYPDNFEWKNPPYEYENILMPIDILAGTDRLRKYIERGSSIKKMEDWWTEELSEFNKKIRRQYFLYK